MKRIKTELRNRMNTSTLDKLLRIRIEGGLIRGGLICGDYRLTVNQLSKVGCLEEVEAGCLEVGGLEAEVEAGCLEAEVG